MQPLDPGTLIGSRLYLAHRFARAATNRALRAHGIDLRHLGVLGELAAHGRRSQRQLVDAGRWDRSSMVYVIDTLERDGLVRRQRDPDDRRAYAVSLTAKGRRRLTAASATAAEVMRGLLEPFSAREADTLADLLGRFAEHARHAEDDQD